MTRADTRRRRCRCPRSRSGDRTRDGGLPGSGGRHHRASGAAIRCRHRGASGADGDRGAGRGAGRAPARRLRCGRCRLRPGSPAPSAADRDDGAPGRDHCSPRCSPWRPSRRWPRCCDSGTTRDATRSTCWDWWARRRGPSPGPSSRRACCRRPPVPRSRWCCCACRSGPLWRGPAAAWGRALELPDVPFLTWQHALTLSVAAVVAGALAGWVGSREIPR